MSNKVEMNVNMFGFGVACGVVGQCDTALVVAEQSGRFRGALGVAEQGRKLANKASQPDDVLGRVCKFRVFRFGAGSEG